MRLIGSFHTITIHGTSGSATSSVASSRSRTGADVVMAQWWQIGGAAATGNRPRRGRVQGGMTSGHGEGTAMRKRLPGWLAAGLAAAGVVGACAERGQDAAARRLPALDLPGT